MKVEEVMTSNVVAAKLDTPLSQVASMLIENRIHGVPVVDGENKVVGIITETDFFTKDKNGLHLPSVIDFVKEGRGDSEASSAVNFVINATAKDVMTSNCVTVFPWADIKEVIMLIKERNFDSIPVVNESGFLEGIITVVDIIKLI